ncbi:MAG: helix-turn-helix domain-containing protein [Polyangiales bacterium]|nr:sigma 54-interacting transcriptional regulator [Myxococcales bacterium]MCB9661381.1 sigma 54-interacting transcriptional regulator [Sandaracinaceae bacterium]
MGSLDRTQPEELTPFVVVSSPEGLRVVELEAGRPLSVGSAADASVIVRGAGVLPLHATLLWQEDSVTLDCLPGASVHVGGKAAEPSQLLEPGEDVVVGDTQLVLGIPSTLDAVRRRTLTHQEFRERLYEELARAGRQSRPTTLIMVSTPPGGGNIVAERALESFRAGDVVGIYAQDELEFLLPDTALGTASTVVERLLDGLEGVSVGLSVAPLDADQPERLFWSARSALEADAARQRSARERREEDTGEVTGDVSLEEATDTLRAALDDVPSDSTWLLLTGEISTGKGLAARIVHERGPNPDGPFVTLYCSELFDADRLRLALGDTENPDADRDGADSTARIDAARGGTLLLDELGDLPREAHVAMRKALLARRDAFRVIGTTQRAIAGLVARGAFDAELFSLFASPPVELPPLRTRTADILPLATRFALEAGSPAPVRWSPGAVARLRSYPWPGNVLELKNAMHRAVKLAGHGELLGEHMPAEPMPIASNRGRLREHVDGMERDAIIKTLADCNHNQTHAAKALGISRRALIYKMEKFGLKPPPRSGRRTTTRPDPLP